MDDFFRFSKKLGFWVFLVHPTAVSVLLSALVERFFVSRMRDFFPLLPEVRCPKFLEIRNPWGKVMERSGLTFEHFFLEVV